jgi:hypothetical protein
MRLLIPPAKTRPVILLWEFSAPLFAILLMTRLIREINPIWVGIDQEMLALTSADEANTKLLRQLKTHGSDSRSG